MQPMAVGGTDSGRSAVSYAYAQVNGIKTLDSKLGGRRNARIAAAIVFVLLLILFISQSNYNKSSSSASSSSHVVSEKEGVLFSTGVEDDSAPDDTEHDYIPDQEEKPSSLRKPNDEGSADPSKEEKTSAEKKTTAAPLAGDSTEWSKEEKATMAPLEEEKTSADPSKEEKTSIGSSKEGKTSADSSNEEKTEGKTGEQESSSTCESRAKDQPGSRRGARIHFLHIPKSGGTSVEHAMKTWGAGRVYRAYSVRNDGSNSKCPPGAVSHWMLAGHRGFGYCDEIKRYAQKYFVFTVFREPVSRLVSLFDMNVKLLKDATYVRVLGNKPLMNLVKDFNRTARIEPGEALIRYMATQQVRYMCGYECFLPRNKTYNDPKFMLARALENMKTLDAVGITAKMNDLVDQLKLHIDWLPDQFRTWPHANEAKVTKSKTDEQARQIIAEWSKEDTELYNVAVEMAERMTKKAQTCLSQQEQVNDGTKTTSEEPEDEDDETEQEEGKENEESTEEAGEQPDADGEGPDISSEEVQEVAGADESEQKDDPNEP